MFIPYYHDEGQPGAVKNPFNVEVENRKVNHAKKRTNRKKNKLAKRARKR